MRGSVSGNPQTSSWACLGKLKPALNCSSLPYTSVSVSPLKVALDFHSSLSLRLKVECRMGPFTLFMMSKAYNPFSFGRHDWLKHKFSDLSPTISCTSKPWQKEVGLLGLWRMLKSVVCLIALERGPKGKPILLSSGCQCKENHEGRFFRVQFWRPLVPIHLSNYK